MSFVPFNAQDFELTGAISEGGQIPDPLATKITELRQGLGTFPEFQLDFFKHRIVRRPGMRGADALVFGRPRAYDGHWFLYTVGGDQDQVQFNIGMFKEEMRVGIGFMIGRQVQQKIQAFFALQSFLGMRPPLPFRDALFVCIKQNNFQIEGLPITDAEEIVNRLETYVVPPAEQTFVFLGSIWKPEIAGSKTLDAYRSIFLALMPFYEELILAGGRYEFHV